MSKKIFLIIIIALLIVGGLVYFFILQERTPAETEKGRTPEETEEITKEPLISPKDYFVSAYLVKSPSDEITTTFKKEDSLAVWSEFVLMEEETTVFLEALVLDSEERIVWQFPPWEIYGGGTVKICCAPLSEFSEGEYQVRIFLNDEEALNIPFEVIN